MYYCRDCGEVFEEARTVKETLSVVDGEPYTEEYDVCPECGGEIGEAEQCDICGEWLPPYEVVDGVCTKCICDGMTEENMRAFILEDLSSFALWLYMRSQKEEEE